MRRLGPPLLRAVYGLSLAALACGVALRLVVWLAPSVAAPLERWLGDALGVPVHVAEAELVWRDWRPGVALEGVRIGGDSPALAVERLYAQPALGASLWARELRWAAVTASGVQAAVAEGQRGWRLRGLPGGASPDGVDLRRLPRRLQVSGARLALIPVEGETVRSAPLDLAARRAAGSLRLGAEAAGDAPGLGRGVRAAVRLPLERPGAARLYARLEGAPVAPWAALLAGRGAVGTLDGALWLELAGGRPAALHGALRGTGLGLVPPGPGRAAAVPGFGGLALAAGFQGQEGRAEIAAVDTTLMPAGLLSEPLPLRRAEAELAGSWAPDGSWSLTADPVRLDSGEARLDARAAVTADGGGDPRLRIHAAGDGPPLERLPAYLAAGGAPPDAVDWVARGVTGGSLRDIQLRLAGRLGDFPFDEGPGTFEASAEIAAGELRYSQAWPRIAGIDARLRLDGTALTIRGSGRTSGVALAGVRVGIADLREPVLEVTGRAEGDARRALAFLADSPLGRSWLGDPVPLHARGAVGVDLDLQLPLASGRAEARRIDGRVQLDGVDAGVGRWLGMEALHGEVRFDAEGVYADEPLSARWGGEPASIEVDTVAIDGEQRIRLEAAGTGTPASLIPALAADPPWLEGVAPWRVRARLPAFQARQPGAITLRVRSSLAGTHLELPEPLGLAGAQRRPLQVDVGFTGRGLTSYWLRYGDELLRAGAEAGTDGLPRAAAVQLGPGALRLPPRGTRVLGRLDRLDLDAWRRWLDGPVLPRLAEGASADVPTWSPPLPLQADVLVRDLRLWGRTYGEQVLAAEADAGAKRRLALRGGLATGDITWQPGFRDVRAELAQLDLPLLDAGGGGQGGGDAAGPLTETLPDAPASSWPEVAAQVAHLRLAGQTAGAGYLHLRPDGEALRLAEAHLRGPALELTGSGVWRDERTLLRVQMGAGDVGDVLSLLGAPRAVQRAEAQIGAELGWPGAPWQVGLAGLTGDIRVHMANGWITDVDPGAGRLVGLLGLRMMPRQVLIDFGQLFGAGFAFDELQGRLTATRGKARIRDLRITGPAAHVTITGDVDLGARAYDNRVRVEPRLGATMPLLGALLGGGVGAVGGFLADQLFGAGVDRAAAVRYRVVGPWNDPRVSRLGVEDASER